MTTWVDPNGESQVLETYYKDSKQSKNPSYLMIKTSRNHVFAIAKGNEFLKDEAQLADTLGLPIAKHQGHALENSQLVVLRRTDTDRRTVFECLTASKKEKKNIQKFFKLMDDFIKVVNSENEVHFSENDLFSTKQIINYEVPEKWFWIYLVGMNNVA
ncbi:MAG: hypothetical protein R3B41_04240 [Candidatus Doudnabacteria bacterium]